MSRMEIVLIFQMGLSLFPYMLHGKEVLTLLILLTKAQAGSVCVYTSTITCWWKVPDGPREIQRFRPFFSMNTIWTTRLFGCQP